MRRLGVFLLAAAWVWCTGSANAAEPLVADLTSHLIAITTGFTGTNVVLFGATDGTGDVIVIVRGPEHETVVRKKSRVAGIWMNTQQATFTNVPSFYAVFSNKPVDEIAPPAMQALHEIGLNNLHVGTAAKNLPPAQLADFRAALFRERKNEGLFSEVGRVTFLGDRLFQTPIAFPANVPTGTYHVEILLVRDKTIVSGQTSPLFVAQVGVDADVHDFATRWALLYGVIAVIGAAVAGWLASLPFRNA